MLYVMGKRSANGQIMNLKKSFISCIFTKSLVRNENKILFYFPKGSNVYFNVWFLFFSSVSFILFVSFFYVATCFQKFNRFSAGSFPFHEKTFDFDFFCILFSFFFNVNLKFNKNQMRKVG